MTSLLLYPVIPAIIMGLLNWLYWKKRGYNSIPQLVVGIMIFYGIFYALFKILLT